MDSMVSCQFSQQHKIPKSLNWIKQLVCIPCLMVKQPRNQRKEPTQGSVSHKISQFLFIKSKETKNVSISKFSKKPKYPLSIG